MPSSESGQNGNNRFAHLPLSTSGAQETSLTVRILSTRRVPDVYSTQGNALLRTPYFNKGSAFTKEERDIFKLHGLLPTNIQTLDEQAKRAYAQYSSRPNDLAKNTFMTSLKEQNEVLYYRVSVSEFS
jgi:malate dehydrogenase (oxaloacetate-decarboxylating)